MITNLTISREIEIAEYKRLSGSTFQFLIRIFKIGFKAKSVFKAKLTELYPHAFPTIFFVMCNHTSIEGLW